MIIGSVSEDKSTEKRVAITPEIIKKYKSLGMNICINQGYARHIGLSDDDYKQEGVEILKNENEVISKSNLIVQLGIPNDQILI